MEERKYYMREIVNELLQQYYLGENGIDHEYREKTRENLRKKIKKICEQNKVNGITLWERATVLSAGREKEDHIFTDSEKRWILHSSELQDYMLKRAKPEEYRRYQKAEELNQQDRDYFDALAEEQARTGALNDGIYGPTAEQIRAKKLEIMIEALFLEIFTPIDEEQLVADLTAVYVADGTGDHTPMDVAAMERLQDNRNYYKRKPKIQK